MHLRRTKPVREPNKHSKETRCFQRKNQLALNKTSKALHRSQNAFPNVRCQSSLKICNSGIGCQLKFHGSDISFMTQISVSWLRQDFNQRSMLMSNFRSRISLVSTMVTSSISPLRPENNNIIKTTRLNYIQLRINNFPNKTHLIFKSSSVNSILHQ